MAHITIPVGISIRVAVRMSVGMSIRRRAPEIPLTIRRAIPPEPPLLRHLHLRLITLPTLTPPRGQKVHKETQHIQTVDECYRPLQACCYIPNMLQAAHAERDDQADFEPDEGELHPEGSAQDRVFAVVYAEALIFPAYEYRGHDVADDEDAEKDIMQPVVVLTVEYRE